MRSGRAALLAPLIVLFFVLILLFVLIYGGLITHLVFILSISGKLTLISHALIATVSLAGTVGIRIDGALRIPPRLIPLVSFAPLLLLLLLSTRLILILVLLVHFKLPMVKFRENRGTRF